MFHLTGKSSAFDDNSSRVALTPDKVSALNKRAAPREEETNQIKKKKISPTWPERI